MIKYTLQPITLTGKLMSFTRGLYDTIEEARDRLLEAGYHETDHDSRCFWNTLKGGCGYHITTISEGSL